MWLRNLSNQGELILADHVEEIKKDQVFVIIVSILFNVRLLYVHNKYDKVLQQDSWIALIIAGVLAIGSTLAYYYVARRFPSLNVLQYTQIIFGKFLGSLFNILNFFFLVLYISFFIRTFSDGIDSFLLDRTPSVVVMISFMLVVAYLCNSGIMPMVKLFELLFPITIIGILLIIILPLKEADWMHLLPILPEGIGRVITRLPLFLSSYIGIGFIGFVFPKTNIKSLGLTVVGAIIVTMILKTLLTLTIFSYFGIEELNNITFPLLYMAKGIDITGGIFQRAETFMMLAWIPITFINISAFFFLAKETVVHFFPKLTTFWVSMVLIIIIIILARVPDSVETNFSYIEYIDYLGVFIAFIYTPFMYLVACVRGLKNEKVV